MSGTFVTLAGAKFEISSHTAHKAIKKVGRKYEVALVNSSFMSVLFSLPVTIHMAFVEEMLRATLQESEAKLEMKIFNSPSFFVWR